MKIAPLTTADPWVHRVMADVSVVTRDDIERHAGSAVADVLMTLPGFQIVRNGDVYGTSSVYLRGAESRHLLVLVSYNLIQVASIAAFSIWLLAITFCRYGFFGRVAKICVPCPRVELITNLPPKDSTLCCIPNKP